MDGCLFLHCASAYIDQSNSVFLYAGSMASESSDATEFRAVCVRRPPQSLDLSCEESADDLGTFSPSPCWQNEQSRLGITQRHGDARISFEVWKIFYQTYPLTHFLRTVLPG